MNFKNYKFYKDYLDKEIRSLIINKDMFHYSLNMIYRFKHYLKLLKHLLFNYNNDINFAILPSNRTITFRIENLKNNKFFDFIIYGDLVCKININNKLYRLEHSTNSFFIKEFELLFNLFIDNRVTYFSDELSSFRNNETYKNWLVKIKDIQQNSIPKWLCKEKKILKSILSELSFLDIADDLYYNPLFKMYVQIISIDIYGTTIKNCTKSSKFYINYKIAYLDIEKLKNKNINSCELYDFCNQLELSCCQNVKSIEKLTM